MSTPTPGDSTMFATAITAARTSYPLNSPISGPLGAVAIHTIARSLLMGIRHRQHWIDLVDQRTLRRQALHRQPSRPRRHTTAGPVLRHRDPPPPLDLTPNEQTMPPALRKQHDQALWLQRMGRMRDHQ